MTTEQVRAYIRDRYIEPARQRGEASVTVVAGDVHRALELQNRVPLVCSALKSRRLEKECDVRVIDVTGPPSGQSTTVRVTFELARPSEVAGTTGGGRGTKESPLLELNSIRGIAKDLFRELGGGEAFIRSERQAFYGDAKGGE